MRTNDVSQIQRALRRAKEEEPDSTYSVDVRLKVPQIQVVTTWSPDGLTHTDRMKKALATPGVEGSNFAERSGFFSRVYELTLSGTAAQLLQALAVLGPSISR